MRLLTLLTATCLLAPLADARQFSSGTADRVIDGTLTGNPGMGANVERTLAANLDEDGYADLVALRGDQLVVTFAPMHFDHHTGVMSGVNDVDVVPGAGTGGTDGLLVAKSTGLFYLEWDGVSGLFLATSVGGALWNDALFVRSGDLTGDGVPDAAGIGPDAKTFLVSVGIAGGGYQAATSFTINRTVQEFCLLDFRTSEPGVEMAAATPFGVNVYREDGTKLSRMHNYAPDDSLSSISLGAGLGEALVWVTGGPTDPLFVTAIDDPNGGLDPVTSTAFPITEADITSAVGVALFPTSTPRVILNDLDASELLILQEDPVQPPSGVPTYTMAGADVLSHSSAGSGPVNRAGAAVADFDGDLALDLAFCSQKDEVTCLWLHNDPVSVTGSEPDLGETLFSYDPATDGILSVQMINPNPDAVHFRVISWLQPSPGEPCEPVALNNQELTLETAPVSQEEYLNVVIPLTHAQFDADAVVFLRIVPENANDHQVGLALVAAYTIVDQAHCEEGNNSEIEYFPGVTGPSDTPRIIWDPVTGQHVPVNEGVTTFGGFVRTKKIARFAGGNLPHKNVPTISSSHGEEHPDTETIGSSGGQS